MTCDGDGSDADDGRALVALLREVLSARASETLTPELIEERARNAAMAIAGQFKICPRKNGQ